MEPELSDIFSRKMMVKNIVLGFPGTHFMHMRVRNVFKVTEKLCIILILNILSSKYFAERLGAFFTLKFSSNTTSILCIWGSEMSSRLLKCFVILPVFCAYEGQKCLQGYWNALYYFVFKYFVFQIFCRTFRSIFHTQVLI